MRRSWLVLGILSVFVGFGWWCWQRWPDQHLHIFFCDVGQGDATLIQYGWFQALIDGGPDDGQAVLGCLAAAIPPWDRTLELVVATHADADHIAGLPAVLKQYQVQTVYAQALDKQTERFEELQQAIQEVQRQGGRVISPVAGEQLVVQPDPKAPELRLTTIWPTAETLLQAQIDIKTEEDFDFNYGSIALLVEFVRFNALLMADMDEKGELALINNKLIGKVKVLKAGHHGSKTSSSWPFLQVTQPEVSVLSLGLRNRYGHPAPEVVSRLEQLDSAIWRTDQLGTLEIITNGTWWRWPTAVKRELR